MLRLFLLYAILIFAKRAPKLIAELLKLKGDNMGLKGLNIKNKMGEAALVGDKVKKGMLAAEGKTKGTVGGFASGFVNTKGGLKERLLGGLKGGITGSKNAGKEAVAKGDSKGLLKKGYNDVTPIARGGTPTLWTRIKGQAKQITENINSKGFSTVERDNSKDFENEKKRLIDMYGSKKANQILAKIGPINFRNQAEYDSKKKELKKYTTGFNGLSYDENTRTVSRNGANLDLSDLAKNPNGQLFIRQNILEERKSVFDKLTSFDKQISLTMQSISPTAQQISAQKSIVEAEKAAAQQRLDSARASNNLAESAKISAEISLIDSKINALDTALANDPSYKTAMDTVATLYTEKTKVYEKAVAEKVFDANGGVTVTDASGNPIDFGIKEISHGTESELYGAMGGDVIAKNNSALSKISESIKELGKDPTPPKKDS